MADRYWVGGSGNSNDTAHWSATSGGAGGASVPTSADNATFDAASNTTNAAYTWTINAAFACLDLKFLAKPGDGLGGTITMAGSAALSIYGSLQFLTGMTVSYTGNVVFAATSGTKAITSNGVANWTNGGTITFNGAGGTFQLADNLSVNPGNFALSAGTFDPNGKTVALTRFLGGTITGAFSFYSLTLTGGATVSNSYVLTGNVTVSALLTIAGAAANQPMLIQSSVLGTARTLSAGSVALSHCHFMDITGAGAAAPFTGTSLGDCLGNSGITFTTAADQYWYTSTSGTKTWSTAGNWFLGSGGTGGAGRVPLPQDNVIFNSASIGAAGTTISAGMPRLGNNITWTGVTNTPTWSVAANAVSIFGSVALSAISWSGTQNFSLYSRSNPTLRTAGVIINSGVFSNAIGTTLTLLDALTTTDRFNINYGSFNDGGFSVAALTVSWGASSSTITKSGAWEISGAGVCFQNLSATTVDTGSIKFSNATTTAKVFAGGSKSYGAVWFASATTFQISGSNSYIDFKADPGAIIQSTAGTTQTAATWHIDGRTATGTDAPCGFLDGSSGASFSTPDAVANRIATSIEIVVKMAAQWSSGVFATLAGKNMSNSGNNKCFLFQIHPSGKLMFYGSSGGASYADAALLSSVATGFTTGDERWAKVTKNTANGEIKFFTASDTTNDPALVTWAQLGTTVAGAIYNFYASSTAAFMVGAWNSGGLSDMATGKPIRVQLINGIGGTVACDMDPSRYTGSGNTFTASTGEVWTRNGNAQFTATNLTTIAGVTNAAFTLAKSGGGVVGCRDLSLRNATASPASTFYAGARSYDGGSNTNWTFNNAPATAMLSATESDTTASTATVAIAAAAAATESDTQASAGTVAIVASVAATESDTHAATGTVAITAASADTDTDTLAATGTNAIAATGPADLDSDTLTATGYRWQRVSNARYVISPAARRFIINPRARNFTTRS